MTMIFGTLLVLSSIAFAAASVLIATENAVASIMPAADVDVDETVVDNTTMSNQTADSNMTSGGTNSTS